MIILVAIVVLLGLLFWFCQRFPGINYATPIVVRGGTRATPDNDYGDLYLTPRTMLRTMPARRTTISSQQRTAGMSKRRLVTRTANDEKQLASPFLSSLRWRCTISNGLSCSLLG
jgi:hypothetical protein